MSASFFPVARSVRKKGKVPAGLKVTELAFTNPQSWAESDLKALEEGKVDYDEGKDLPGPISLAALVESKENRQKMVVVGDSDFITNGHLNMAGNRPFAIKIIQWMLNEKPLVLSKSTQALRDVFILKPREKALFSLVAVIGVPGFFAGIGLVIFGWQKRHE